MAAPNAVPIELTNARRRVNLALSKLGHLTGNCAVVFAQDDLACPLLRDMGWSSAETASTFQNVPSTGDVDALLIVSHGDHFSGIRHIMTTMNKQLAAKTCPLVMVVLVGATLQSDVNDTDPVAQARAKVEFACQLAPLRAQLLDAGADEVTGLLPDEYLEPNRLIECIQRTDYICTQLKDILSNELANAEERCQRLLNTAQQKLLAMLPGRILESLPAMDKDLPETRDAQGELLSVGEYEVQKRLGTGTFGSVHLVNCPKRGRCAIKIIPKRNLKKLSALISLDHETAFMLFAGHHPNVVRAYDAIHGPQNFYIVMEYGGEMSVYDYTRKLLEQGMALTVEKVRSFCSQEANAIGHLHWHNIVHRDIKPENWLLSDDGMVLKLADFNLAMQLSGPGHLLKQCCGSKPFCAPEVFNCKLQTDAWGYDGLAADVWSLAVGYVEHVLGPFAVERNLLWLPNHPTDDNLVYQGLRSIPDLWKQHASHDKTGVGQIIPWMLALNPAERFKITQVQNHPVFAEAAHGGLSANTARFQLRPLTAGYPQSLFGKSNRDIAPAGVDARLLSARLGGGRAIKSVFNRAFENFSRTAGFAEHMEPHMRSLHALCSLLGQEHVALFDSAEGTQENLRLRRAIEAASHGLPLVEPHFANLRDRFRMSLHELQFDEDTVNEGVNKVQSYSGEITCHGQLATSLAVRANTPQWRARVLAMATASQVSGYIEHLRSTFANSFVLGRTSLRHMSNNEIHGQLITFLNSDRRDMLPIALPQDAMRPAEHLTLVSAVRNALCHSAWPEDVVDTMQYLLLHRWQSSMEAHNV